MTLRFDIIIVDSTDFGAAQPLFEESFHRQLKQVMAKNSVLVWNPPGDEFHLALFVCFFFQILFIPRNVADAGDQFDVPAMAAGVSAKKRRAPAAHLPLRACLSHPSADVHVRCALRCFNVIQGLQLKKHHH